MPFTSQIPLHRRRIYPNSSRALTPKVQSDGSVCDVYREDPVLPPCENFRLSNILKAGIPLQEVNTKILGASSVDLSNLPASSGTEPSVTEPSVAEPSVTEPSIS